MRLLLVQLFRNPMYKLLPEESKKMVEGEYARRRLIVWLGALSIVLVIGLVGALPSYILARARTLEMAERVKTTTLAVEASADDVALTEWLSNTSRQLLVLNPTLDTDRPSQIIITLLSERPSSVRLDFINWSKDDNGKISLTTSGTATDRQGLLFFERALKDSTKFSEVSLPLSNLAKDRNLSFQIKLIPKP